ncbi:WGxxGxxG-CTERM domain-containing protein [Paenibacillus sp. sptzw28]|nr:WGxxGxxG-CTERM domain-containing protein [Paenibacillus sp. sptzw28]
MLLIPAHAEGHLVGTHGTAYTTGTGTGTGTGAGINGTATAPGMNTYGANNYRGTAAANDNNDMDWGWLGLLGLIGLAGLRNRNRERT